MAGEVSHEKTTRPYFPLNPGCLIGILRMVYEIIPIYLGRISSPIYPKQPGFFWLLIHMNVTLYGKIPLAVSWFFLLLMIDSVDDRVCYMFMWDATENIGNAQNPPKKELPSLKLT